jgi:hypothetical protein
MTFTAIATAVRGQWWDQELYGKSLMDEKELTATCNEEVMFGIDGDGHEHAGLAPKVSSIHDFIERP